MADIKGVKAVGQALNRLSKKAGKSRVSVIVGYTANYATAVHENAKMEARRRLRKKSAGRQQWKFLEQPAREFQDDLAKIVTIIFEKTGNMKLALVAAAMRLQAESQKIVPVDTGNLKGSAFTEVEK